jgi:transposase-like protein
VLVELGVVEQGYRAVLEVLQEGAPVTEVARRYGVARQRVHEWLARYGARLRNGHSSLARSGTISGVRSLVSACNARVHQ